MLQVVFEVAQAGAPEAAVGAEPNGDLVQRLGPQFKDMLASNHLLVQQPGGGQNFQMLGDGGTAAVKRSGQYVHRLGAAFELVEQGALPGRPGVKRLIESALDAGWVVAVASTSATKSVEAVLTSVVGPQTRARMAGVWAGDIVPAIAEVFTTPPPEAHRAGT